MGVASVDSAARVCHAPSTLGLKATIGVAASTCSLQDVIESDLIVLWGTNLANNQPVFTKYLYLAKARGAKVVVVNPYLEPGLEHYWVPSSVESALFGTKICDLHVPVRPGRRRRPRQRRAQAADRARRRRRGLRRRPHRRAGPRWSRTSTAWTSTDLLIDAGRHAWRSSTRSSTSTRRHRRRSSCGAWASPSTAHGVEGVQGDRERRPGPRQRRPRRRRAHAHPRPLRRAGRRRDGRLRHRAARAAGPSTHEHAGRLGEPVGLRRPRRRRASPPPRWSRRPSGASSTSSSSTAATSSRSCPTRRASPRPSSGCRCACTRTSCSRRQMLVDGDDVILLPAATRYEQEGGGTETTTERRVVFTPEIPRQVGEARSEWRIFADLAARVRPDLAAPFAWPTNRDLRAEIAAVVPAYAGIEDLVDTGDAIQWGGRHLCAGGGFPTPDGRARFTALDPPGADAARRGLHGRDPAGQAVQLHGLRRSRPADRRGTRRRPHGPRRRRAPRPGRRRPAPAHERRRRLRGHGPLVRLPGAHAAGPLARGQRLVPGGPEHREPGTNVPDYNAVVWVEPVEVDQPSRHPS